MYFQATKPYGRISAITWGIEGYTDRIIYLTKGDINYSVLGIHGGHSFIFGRVEFSQQIGYHLYDNVPHTDNIYLRFGLSYRLLKHFKIGINLKTHSDNAEFTDFRLGYRF